MIQKLCWKVSPWLDSSVSCASSVTSPSESLSLSLSISFGLFVVRIEECCACRFWFWGFWMSVVLNCELLLLICCCFECFWFLIWIFWSDWWSKMEWGFEFYWLSNYGDCYVSVCVLNFGKFGWNLSLRVGELWFYVILCRNWHCWIGSLICWDSSWFFC